MNDEDIASAVLINIPRNLTLVGFMRLISAMNILNCVMNRLMSYEYHHQANAPTKKKNGGGEPGIGLHVISQHYAVALTIK